MQAAKAPLFQGSVKISASRHFQGVKEIDRWAFFGCKSLQKVVLPNSLKTIMPYAFSGCPKIKDINISNSIRVGKDAFEECLPIEFVIINGELRKYKGENPVVVIPDQTKKIKSTIFANKKRKIKEVIIPDTVEEIEDGAFQECMYLQKVKLSSRLKIISFNLFRGCKSLEQIEIPEGVSIIKPNAFRYCYSLKEIRLPYSIVKIDELAFGGTLDTVSTDIHTIVVAPGTGIDEIVSAGDKFAAAVGFLKYPDLYKDEIIIQNDFLINELLYVMGSDPFTKMLQVAPKCKKAGGNLKARSVKRRM